MRVITSVILPCVVPLSACVSASSDSVTSSTFECENATRIVVEFREADARVLYGGGRVAVLSQSRAASGFHYADQHHVLRGQGDEVIWTWGEHEPTTCRVRS